MDWLRFSHFSSLLSSLRKYKSGRLVKMPGYKMETVRKSDQAQQSEQHWSAGEKTASASANAFIADGE